MAAYKVFRMKENLRQQFRWAPHLSGLTAVKPKDYEELFTVEAQSPYAAWHELKGTERELKVGDLLSAGENDVRILKYIGFEEARWIVPEPPRVPIDGLSQDVSTIG
jgi:hypothetical protein